MRAPISGFKLGVNSSYVGINEIAIENINKTIFLNIRHQPFVSFIAMDHFRVTGL